MENKDLKLEYNTGRNKMVIPEYGRNIQKMIEYAIDIEDDAERNKVAQAIVNVMGQLNPHLRDINDFKHKLWDHLFIISDFKLKVDSPYEIPSRQTLTVKPERVPYPDEKIRYKHYGKTVEKMIGIISKNEDSPDKMRLITNLGNFMKMAYMNYNRDTVSDDVILEQMKELSRGKLEFDNSDIKLAATSELRVKKENKKSQKRKKGGNGGHKHKKKY